MENFFDRCYSIIMCTDIAHKNTATKELYQQLITNKISVTHTPASPHSITSPGRPATPILVAPLDVPKRRVGSKEGHAGLIHALAHIEFNAINLALDACYRFRNMPVDFYHNWLQVAAEEVYHFELLNAHLATLGYTYGDFSAHNGLWEMAVKTEHDVLARMALVPRTLEARGVDAVPEMQEKLRTVNDIRAIEILDIIHHDEIKHVAFGDKWFKQQCEQRNVNSEETFFELFTTYNAPKIRGPFNRVDRKKAGFSDHELERLYNL